MSEIIRIPKRYYDDHRDCVSEFESPNIIKQTKSHYYIDAKPGDDWDEFVSRCEFYAADEPNVDATIDNGLWAIIRSARATLKVIKNANH